MCGNISISVDNLDDSIVDDTVIVDVSEVLSSGVDDFCVSMVETMVDPVIIVEVCGPVVVVCGLADV